MIVQPPHLLALIWRPFFAPMPVLVFAALLVGLALFACVRSFRHRPGISVPACLMRLALIAVVTLLLMGPSTMPPVTHRPDRPTLTLALDLSGSMQTPDVANGSRLRYAIDRWLNPEQLDALRADYDVRLIGLDDHARPIDPAMFEQPDAAIAAGDISRIAETMTNIIGDLPADGEGSAVVLLSDGHDTEAQPFQHAAKLAAAKDIVLHTVALGGKTSQRDLALLAKADQPYIFVGEEGKLTLRVLQANADEHTTTLTIRDGEGGLIETHDLRFDNDNAVAMSIPISHDKAGTYEYKIDVATIDGEVEPNNNTQSVFIDVIDERLKVLILEGEPFWDTKFIAHSLRSDERVGVTQITQIAPGRTETIVTRVDADDAAVPTSLEDLAAYDVIVLGKRIEQVLPERVIGQLPQYVAERGGRVIFARGRATDPTTAEGRAAASALSVIEPVVWGDGLLHDQSLAVETTAMSHPSFVGAGGRIGVERVLPFLPALSILPVIQKEKPSARVLARARPAGATGVRGQPALVTMPYDRGMVVAVLGEGLWRWRLIGRKDKELAGVFDRFWSSMIRWMVMGSDYQPGQEITLRLAQRSVQVGHAMSFDIISRSPLDTASAAATLTGPGDRPQHIALRPVAGSPLRHRATFEVKTSGTYTVVFTSNAPDSFPLESKFNAYEINTERLYSSAKPSALRTLAQLSGGQVLHPSKPDELLDALDRHRASLIVPPQPRYVWDKGWILTLILLWVGVEWLIRKRGGLL